MTLRVAADARRMRPIAIGPSQLRSRHIVEKLFIPITIRILLVVHGRAAGPGKIGVASALFARRTTKNDVGKKLKKTYFSKVLSTRHMGKKDFRECCRHATCKEWINGRNKKPGLRKITEKFVFETSPTVRRTSPSFLQQYEDCG